MLDVGVCLGGMGVQPRPSAWAIFVGEITSIGFVKWVRTVYVFGPSAVVDSHPGQ